MSFFLVNNCIKEVPFTYHKTVKYNKTRRRDIQEVRRLNEYRIRLKSYTVAKNGLEVVIRVLHLLEYIHRLVSSQAFDAIH